MQLLTLHQRGHWHLPETGIVSLSVVFTASWPASGLRYGSNAHSSPRVDSGKPGGAASCLGDIGSPAAHRSHWPDLGYTRALGLTKICDHPRMSGNVTLCR